MKRFVFLILLIPFGFSAHAQDYTNLLHPIADKIWRAWYVYNKNPLSMTDQLFFLQCFPKTKDDFIFTFDPDDKKQLYKPSGDFIQAFEDIGKTLPDSVLKLGIQICKQMKWAAGVSERFQHAMLTVAANNPVKFVDWAYTLKRKELAAAITYLADVESTPECAVYKKLISNLHEVGAYNLEGMLQRARTYSH